MGICYNPKIFTPDNKPLLSKGQWSMIQLFLVDAANLPLTNEAFPDPASIPIFKAIHDAAAFFKSDTLPKSNALGNTLYNYGSTANATFAALVNIMETPNPDKNVLLQLFGNLQNFAQQAQIEAKQVFDGTQGFVNVLGDQKSKLDKVVTDEVNAKSGYQSQITVLNNDITAQRSSITSAQATITSDKKVIHDTVYYSWIPLIGTIVALAEIITSSDDIKKQLGIINDAVKAIQGDNLKLEPLNQKVGQLIYAQDFNNGQIKQIGEVMPVLQTIQGAWGTISSELGDALGHINNAQADQLKGLTYLAEVELTTAANQWQDVANDAHDYMMNFYITPATAKAA
jgi:hypothetical protein